MKGLPFNFVEKERTRENTKLDPISTKSLVKHIENPTQLVEKEVAKELPDTFGLIIDGWIDGSTSTHYFAIFGCYQDKNEPGNSKSPLLTMSPLLDEEKLDAEEHLKFVEAT